MDPRRFHIPVFLGLLLLVSACSGDSNGGGFGYDTDLPDDGNKVPGTGGGGGDGDGDMDAYCMGQGPPIKIPDGNGGDVCAGSVARTLFNHAVCSCDDVTFAGYLKTRAFSAEEGVYYQGGAPVGVNDQVVSGSYVDVGGTLTVVGDSTVGGYLQVRGDFETHNPFNVLGLLEVSRDAWIENGGLAAAAAIGRDLNYATALPPPFVLLSGNPVQQSFMVDDPCPCDPDELLDIPAIVQDGRVNNHNAQAGIDPGILSGLVGLHRVELPCGRYYIDEVSGVGDVQLVVNGRTALYVGGDISNVGIFDIELGPQGEIDIYVEGNLNQIGYSPFGNVTRPSGVRIYVAGDQQIDFAGFEPFGGNLYAPHADLYAAGYIDITGSIFVHDVWSGNYIDVEYDLDILEVGGDPECGPDEPPPGEPQCNSKCSEACAVGQACVEGYCTACGGDSDCCGALICDHGACVPQVNP